MRLFIKDFKFGFGFDYFFRIKFFNKNFCEKITSTKNINNNNNIINNNTIIELENEIKELELDKNFQKANHKLNKLISIYFKDKTNGNNFPIVFQKILHLCNNLRKMNDYTKSIETLQSLLSKLSKKDENVLKSQKLELLQNIINDYIQIKDYANAKKNLLEAIRIQQKITIDNTNNELENNTTLVSLYYKLINVLIESDASNQEFFPYLENCLQIYNDYPDSVKEFELDLLILSSEMFISKEDYETAIDVLLKAENMTKNNIDLFDICKSLAQCFNYINDKDEALKYYKKALDCVSDVAFDEEITKFVTLEKAHILENIAEIELFNGEINNSYNSIVKALNEFLKYNQRQIVLNKCYYLLCELYYLKKEFTKSVEYGKKFLFAFDDYFNQNNEKELIIEEDTYDQHELKLKKFKILKFMLSSFQDTNDKENLKIYYYKARELLNDLNSEKIDKNELTKEDKEDEESIALTNYIISKYESAQLNEYIGDYDNIINDYNEIIDHLVKHKLSNVEWSDVFDEFLNLDFVEDDCIVNKNFIIMDCLLNIANILFSQEKYEEAKKEYNKILQMITVNSYEEHTKDIKDEINTQLIKIKQKLIK